MNLLLVLNRTYVDGHNDHIKIVRETDVNGCCFYGDNGRFYAMDGACSTNHLLDHLLREVATSTIKEEQVNTHSLPEPEVLLVEPLPEHGSKVDLLDDTISSTEPLIEGAPVPPSHSVNTEVDIYQHQCRYAVGQVVENRTGDRVLIVGIKVDPEDSWIEDNLGQRYYLDGRYAGWDKGDYPLDLLDPVEGDITLDPKRVEVLTLETNRLYRNGLGQVILIIGEVEPENSLYKKGYRFCDDRGSFYRPDGFCDGWLWKKLNLLNRAYSTDITGADLEAIFKRADRTMKRFEKMQWITDKFSTVGRTLLFVGTAASALSGGIMLAKASNR